jgi:hypothetical protein
VAIACANLWSVLAIALGLFGTPLEAQFAYVANSGANTVLGCIGRLDVDLVAAPGSCTIDGHPIKMDEVLLGPGRRGDRFRRVRKADTPLLARCTAPRSSASWAGRLEGHSRGTNEKGLNYASAR